MRGQPHGLSFLPGRSQGAEVSGVEGMQHAAKCTHRFLQVWGPVECVAGIFPHMPECDSVYPSMCCFYMHVCF